MPEYLAKRLKRMTLKHYMILGAFSAFFCHAQSLADLITSSEGQNGLLSWEWRDAGVSVKLVQRLPYQTRVFFQGRNFSSRDADIIKNAYAFQTIYRNDVEQPLSYNLNDRRISHQGQQRTLFTREHWDKKWV